MRSRSSAAAAFCGAVLAAALLLAFWYFTFRTADSGRFNLSIIDWVAALPAHSELTALARGLTSLVTARICAAATAVLVIVCLYRRLPVLALAIVGIVGAANLTTELLKPVLSGPIPGGGPVILGFPSGHVTAVAALALCAVVAVRPGLLRALVGIVALALTVATAGAVVILGWHYPSDAVAGALVSTGWWFVGLAVTRLAGTLRWPVLMRSGAAVQRD